MDLGSLNAQSIENIISSMSQQDLEQLSSLAAGLFSGTADNENNKEKQSNEEPDFETITKIASVLGKLSSQPKNPGCELIAALKPMLSPERRHKADEAIKILQLISLLPLIRDLQ